MQQPLAMATREQEPAAPIPASAGIGLKACHFGEILETGPACGWFEVHPENYLVAGGPLHHYLTRIRSDYPLSFHSVGMSLGSANGVELQHLQRLRDLADRYQPALCSDHLSWSRWDQHYLNDLLPLPYTEEALQIFCDNVDQAQQVLGRSIAIENPSVYLALPAGDMDECDFLLELTRRTGATLLLDVNNLHVSGSNQGWSPQAYLQRIPAALVREIHLAGHKVELIEAGTMLIDDHGSRVCDEVWALYQTALRQFGPKPTLIEWDTNVPTLDILLAEAAKAETLLGGARTARLRKHG